MYTLAEDVIKLYHRILYDHFNVFHFLQIMFSTMLIMNSVFVLTSVEKGYESTGEFFEYYVYVWAAGDFLEEMICCFVYILATSIY